MVRSAKARIALAVVILVAAAAAYQFDPAASAAVGGVAGFVAVAMTQSRFGSNHDPSWRRAWWLLALAAAAATLSAALYVHVDTNSVATLGAALVGAIGIAGAGFNFFQHRVSRGRAVDVLFEGVLAALAIALSLSASTRSLEEYPLIALAWFSVPLVYLAGVWILVRALALSQDPPLATRIVLGSVAAYFAVYGIQGVAPLVDLQVRPDALAGVVAVAGVVLAMAASHPSVDERFSPVPATAAGLTRAHVVLLVAAIITAPVVSVVRSGAATDALGLQLAIMILFPLLVVIHLVRQVQERATGEYRAQHDDLTGLPNRVLFHDRLEVALAQARRQSDRVAVMFVDLDRFKRINDSLGHDVGDEVLRGIATRLKKGLREEDTVARLGGDEFAVLLHSVSPSDVRVVGDKLLRVLDEPVAVGERLLPIGASIGVAMFPQDGQNADSLLKNADIAMYRAKSSARGQLQFYTAEMSAKAQLRLAVESALRSALSQRELTVHYQPRVRASSGKIVGFEALVRWQHPTLGDISPGAFIPVAEESGLILDLGAWVLHEACRQNAAWREAGLIDVPVSVNLSARQFADVDVEQLVVDVLRATGLPPRSLELEITESVLMRDVGAAADLLNRLRVLGVRSSIDDFGTGYSGLSYLAKMPVDTLKIDRSFVAEMTGEGAPIISAVIALARSLDVDVVAEGVETEGQVEALRMLDCDEMQGFLYARPMPAEAIERLVRRWHARTVDASAEGGHLTQRVITDVLLAATDESRPFVDLDAANAVLSALSDRTPELRSLAAAGLLTSTTSELVRAAASRHIDEEEDEPLDEPRPDGELVQEEGGAPNWRSRGGYGA
ncbi:MAG: EAL domain-containing protein [Nitriliruptorales bacterium]|nr:EAL domain-containing protein [Nitriliruptorales bacterium]